jgi:hypothetical protein
VWCHHLIYVYQKSENKIDINRRAKVNVWIITSVGSSGSIGSSKHPSSDALTASSSSNFLLSSSSISSSLSKSSIVLDQKSPSKYGISDALITPLSLQSFNTSY